MRRYGINHDTAMMVAEVVFRRERLPTTQLEAVANTMVNAALIAAKDALDQAVVKARSSQTAGK